MGRAARTRWWPALGSLLALVGCSEPPGGAGLGYRHEGTVTTTVRLLATARGVFGSAEFVVPAGASLHAYSETEFLSGEHEAFFRLGDGLELSTRIPDLAGPTTHTLELGPLPPGSKACYSLGVSVSSGDEGPELLELNGCVRGDRAG